MTQNAAQWACFGGLILMGGMYLLDVVRYYFTKKSSDVAEAGLNLFLTMIFGLLLYKAGTFTTIF